MYATPVKRNPAQSAPRLDKPAPISSEYAQSLLRLLIGGNDSLFSEDTLPHIPNGQQLYVRNSTLG